MEAQPLLYQSLIVFGPVEPLLSRPRGRIKNRPPDGRSGVYEYTQEHGTHCGGITREPSYEKNPKGAPSIAKNLSQSKRRKWKYYLHL
jgi:hypothetical protein